MAEKEQNTKQQHAQGQHEMRPMLKYHADALVVALAVTPRDEDLYAHGKTHRQGGEDEVIQARHHRGTQFVGAEVTEKSGVGEGDDGLCQVTQHDGVCNAPDFAVGDCRSSHKNQENAHQKKLDYQQPNIAEGAMFKVRQSSRATFNVGSERPDT